MSEGPKKEYGPEMRSVKTEQIKQTLVTKAISEPNSFSQPYGADFAIYLAQALPSDHYVRLEKPFFIEATISPLGFVRTAADILERIAGKQDYNEGEIIELIKRDGSSMRDDSLPPASLRTVPTDDQIALWYEVPTLACLATQDETFADAVQRVWARMTEQFHARIENTSPQDAREESSIPYASDEPVHSTG